MTADTILSALEPHLTIDRSRWPDRHGRYHADCPYCKKPAKRGQTHFTMSLEIAACYCQVCGQGGKLTDLAKHLGIELDDKIWLNGNVEYDYVDVEGHLLYQSVRYYKDGEKRFYQQQPNGIKNVNGVERVLYRLPEVLEAVREGRPIYIVEGEKDVETLRLYGLTATTNVGGAGKWRAAYGDVLRGAHVFLIPDNDAPGRAHMDAIARGLAGKAASIRRIELPGICEKGDVTDWIEAGHTIAELQALIVTPRETMKEYVVDWRNFGISAADLQRKIFPALRWIIDGILPEGATLLAGKPKSKKSWLALAAAAAVAMGGKVIGYYDVSPGDVLYLDLESNQRRMKSRLSALIGAILWPANLHIFTKWERGLAGIALLDAWMDTHPETKLIVIDILQNFRPLRVKNANPYDEDYEAVQMINEFAERHRIAVIIIHHTRKAKADDVFDEISGTTGLSGGVTSMWVLGRSPDNSGESILAIRGRDISDDDPLAVRWDNYTCQFVRVASGQEISSGAARRHILDVMDESTEYHLKEIAAAVQKSVSATSNLIRRLMDDGLIQRVGNGRYARIPSPIPYQSESRESRLDGESCDSCESLGPETFTSGGDVKVGCETFYPLPERTDPHFHDFHSDSHETPHERAKRLSRERSLAAGWHPEAEREESDDH